MASLASSDQPNPQLLWEACNGYQKTAALRAAIELDVFTAVGEGAQEAERIAARCNASPRGIRILCDYLAVSGFLTKTGNSYALTPTSAAFLDRRSPACMASILGFINAPHLLAGFANLTDAVRQGTTQLGRDGFTAPELHEWVAFAESMVPMIREPAEFIGEEAVRAKTPRRVLDIAAGHGLFGIAVARRAPEADITAQDWPNVLEVAKKNAREAGVAARYKLLPGDAFAVDFGNGYDLALLTNFLHHFDRPACVTLLRRLHASLSPGGRLMTLEFVPNEDRVSPPIPAMFSLMMLGLTPAGDAYTMSELDAMLREAGFSQNRLIPVPRSPQHLIASTK